MKFYIWDEKNTFICVVEADSEANALSKARALGYNNATKATEYVTHIPRD